LLIDFSGPQASHYLHPALLLIYLLLLKVIVFSLGSSLVMVQHSALVFLSVLLSTILKEEVTFLFVCFIDFSKAFDKVNYWKLLNKLLDYKIDISITRVLAYWFSKQELSVRWQSAVSQSFAVGNGTRQGGILSPYLFTRYIRELRIGLQSTQSG
jgi:hypothetical protein